jgi:hypothetical protein
MDRRDEKVSQIARKLAEHQRRMLNLAVQLQALYQGRKEDVAGLLKEEEGGGESAKDGVAGRLLGERVAAAAAAGRVGGGAGAGAGADGGGGGC